MRDVSSKVSTFLENQMKTGQRIEAAWILARVYVYESSCSSKRCIQQLASLRLFLSDVIGKLLISRRMTENGLAQCRVRAKRQIVTEQKRIPKRNGMDTDKIVEANARLGAYPRQPKRVPSRWITC